MIFMAIGKSTCTEDLERACWDLDKSVQRNKNLNLVNRRKASFPD